MAGFKGFQRKEKANLWKYIKSHYIFTFPNISENLINSLVINKYSSLPCKFARHPKISCLSNLSSANETLHKLLLMFKENQIENFHI